MLRVFGVKFRRKPANHGLFLEQGKRKFGRIHRRTSRHRTRCRAASGFDNPCQVRKLSATGNVDLSRLAPGTYLVEISARNKGRIILKYTLKWRAASVIILQGRNGRWKIINRKVLFAQSIVFILEGVQCTTDRAYNHYFGPYLDSSRSTLFRFRATF